MLGVKLIIEKKRHLLIDAYQTKLLWPSACAESTSPGIASV
jgi:hypothetical protein